MLMLSVENDGRRLLTAQDSDRGRSRSVNAAAVSLRLLRSSADSMSMNEIISSLNPVTSVALIGQLPTRAHDITIGARHHSCRDCADIIAARAMGFNVIGSTTIPPHDADNASIAILRLRPEPPCLTESTMRSRPRSVRVPVRLSSLSLILSPGSVLAVPVGRLPAPPALVPTPTSTVCSLPSANLDVRGDKLESWLPLVLESR